MKPSAVADALICAFHSLTNTLPVEHRRDVNAILFAVLRDVDMVQDVETRQLLWRLADLPTRGAPRTTRPSRRRAAAAKAASDAAQA
jgi:hypothetical protein